MEQRRQLGNDSENLAGRFLEQKGYEFVENNFSCKRGEIDLIVRKENLLVFVEVRSKSSAQYGQPLETVNCKKQEKIHKAAEYYLYLHPELAELYCRFDVISILWQEGKARLNWIADAFQ